MKTQTKQKPMVHLEDTIPSHDKKTPGADYSDAQVDQDGSTRFREDILRRYEAPFRSGRRLRSRAQGRA